MKPLLRGVLLLAVVMIFPDILPAQTDYAIGKGSFTLGGEASLSSYGGDRYGENERLRAVRFNPDVMYFLVSHLAVGGSFSISSSSWGDNSSSTFGIGPAVGVWFGRPNSSLFPFVMANIFFRESQSDRYSYSMTSYQASAGIDLMLAKNIALTTKISYAVESHSSESGDFVTDDNANEFTLGVGFRAFVF